MQNIRGGLPWFVWPFINSKYSYNGEVSKQIQNFFFKTITLVIAKRKVEQAREKQTMWRKDVFTSLYAQDNLIYRFHNACWRMKSPSLSLRYGARLSAYFALGMR